MSVLRRAFVEVEPDVTGFDTKLKAGLARADPGGKAGKQVGGQLNRALKRFNLDAIDITANPRAALAGIATAEARLRELSGQAATVEVKIQTERALGQLTRFRKSIGDVTEDAGPEAATGFAGRFGAKLGPLLANLPIASPMGAALAGAGAAGAPIFVSALASGLAAGAGLGVIGVGLSAVAKSPVVKLRGAEVGRNFSEGLQREAAKAFGGPVLGALDQLDAAGGRLAARLGVAFDKLAPSVEDFTGKVIGAGEAVTGSLAGAAERSGPAISGLGDSITLLGKGAAYFVETVADGGPQAADNLRLIAGATADLVKQSANVLDITGKLASNSWLTGPLLPLLRAHYKEAAGEAQRLADKQARIPPEFDLTARAARGQRDALVALSTEMKAQTDPAFALLDAQQKLKKAEDDAAAAVKKHGRNSVEAKEATRSLAMAAIDLESKAGALSGSFTGKLTPAMVATYRAAGLTEAQISDVEGEFVSAKRAGDKFDGKFTASVSSKGVPGVLGQFNALLVQQRALQNGISLGAAQSAMQKDLDRNRQRAYAMGGWTGPGSKFKEAGVVHADEFVIKKESRRRIEQRNPGLLSEMNATGQMPGYAAGGRVWPFPADVSKTRVPSLAKALSKVTPVFSRDWPSSPMAQRGDSGIWKSVLRLIKSGPKSGSFGNAYRPGDPKWHGSGRAVDWMGYNQDALAQFLAAKKPLELIHRTRNRDYAYTRGRNKGSFNNALMNAHKNHVHVAMANGGVIKEPVAGVGLSSGKSYSFGERGPETVTPGVGGGTTVINVNVTNSMIASKRQAEDMLVNAWHTAISHRRIGARDLPR